MKVSNMYLDSDAETLKHNLAYQIDFMKVLSYQYAKY